MTSYPGGVLGGPDPDAHEDLLGEDAPGREDEFGSGDAPGREDVLGEDAPGRDDELS
jgi:hypothetical protein